MVHGIVALCPGKVSRWPSNQILLRTSFVIVLGAGRHRQLGDCSTCGAKDTLDSITTQAPIGGSTILFCSRSEIVASAELGCSTCRLLQIGISFVAERYSISEEVLEHPSVTVDVREDDDKLLISLECEYRLGT